MVKTSYSNLIGPKYTPTQILKSDWSILKCSNLIGPKCAPAEILKSDWWKKEWWWCNSNMTFFCCSFQRSFIIIVCLVNRWCGRWSFRPLVLFKFTPAIKVNVNSKKYSSKYVSTPKSPYQLMNIFCYSHLL